MRVLEAGRRKPVDLLAFSPDGRWLAARSDGVVAWDLAGSAVPVRHDRNIARPPAFLPDGRLLTLDFDQEFIRAADPGRGATELPFRLTARADFALSPDGRRLVACDTSRLRAWELRPAGGWEETWSHPPGAARTYEYSRVAVTADRVAVAEFVDSTRQRVVTVVIRDGATGRPVAEVVSPTGYPDQLALAPDATRLVIRTGLENRFIVIDPIGPGAKPRTVVDDESKTIDGLALHPSGRFVATAGGRSVRLWDAASWTVDRTFDWDALGFYSGVAFSPDGTLAAAGTYAGQVVVWDVDL